MLNFVVFEADAITAGNFPPRHAYLTGPDDLPLQGELVFEPNLIACKADAQHSIALHVQVEIGKAELGEGATITTGESAGLGLLTIPTCLLPRRLEPYLLMIELARHRIMLFLNKLEDWGLVDLPADHPVIREFEQARHAFTSALVAQRDIAGDDNPGGFCPKAGKLAAQTLALAIDAGEGLTLIQADKQIKERLGGKSYASAVAHYQRLTQEKVQPGAPVVVTAQGGATLPGPPLVGCAISPASCTEPQQKAALNLCDFITMPVRWVDMEPVEGKYAFTNTDRWIEWAVRVAKLPIHAGPLVDFRPSCVPEWLYIWENDYETLRDIVVEHVQAIVTRYRRTITRWTVASGLAVNTNFKVSFEQIMDLTRITVLLVKKLHPQAKIQLEVAQPWGEYHAANRRSIPPLLYAEAVLQSNLPIDAIGLRLQMGHAEPGLSSRDLMSLSAVLDRYAMFDKPVAVSALGAPSQPIPAQRFRPRAGSDTDSSMHEPGYWRKPWSDQQQADWLTAAMSICCSKPYVHSVCWQELMDPVDAAKSPEMPHGGLLLPSGQAKIAAARMMQLRSALREGRSPLNIKA